jgi:hypothetical protein
MKMSTRHKVILFAFLFMKAGYCIASHAVGADLTYVSLGGNNYRIFFTLYRDCSGIAVDSTYRMKGVSTCGDSILFSVAIDSMSEVRHLCKSIATKCESQGSAYMGIEANYFHQDILLPSVCNHWTFGLNYSICNRSALISNIYPNASTYCLYVKATLNNLDVSFNNSPSFYASPVLFLCANQVQTIHANSYDADNDSLTFEMYAPHSSEIDDVQYIAGLSATQPITYIGDSTQFNSFTGDIRFKADGSQVTVAAIRITDYRNGVMVGSVERDMELIFESCLGTQQNQPVATGINGTPVFTTHVCYDSLLSFQIFTNDIDSDSTFISWNHGIYGGVLTAINGFFQAGIFSWHPDSSDINSSPYSFNITVTDNSCPSNTSNSYLFQIYVDACQATTYVNNFQNVIRSFMSAYSPASHAIRFAYGLTDACEASISLYDLMGRELKKIFLETSVSRKGEFMLPELSAGLYIVNLKTSNGFSDSIKVPVE